MTTRAFRVGVVGAGAITQVAHLPVLSKMRNATTVALCDNDGPKARAIADRFGIPNVFTDIEDMLELEQIDAVVIATPNHLHEPHVLAALASKVDVMCERPLALTLRGVERILAAAQRSGRKVLVGNSHRFRSDVQMLSRFLTGGELGKTLGIRTGTYRLQPPTEGWRFRRAEAGGGAFMEFGLPLLDLALWLTDFPAPERVSVHADRPKSASAVEDAMLVHLECEQGISMSFDIAWSYVGEEDRWWFEVLANRGSARLAPLRVVKTLNGKPTDVSPHGAAARESQFIQSYRAQLAHAVAVLAGESAYEPPTDQLVIYKTLEAIYRSADEGKELKL